MLISKNSKKQIDLFLKDPSNSLVIESNAYESGLEITYDLIKKLLDLNDNNDLDNYSYFYKIQKNKNNTVAIDDIRDLIKRLNLKSLNKNLINRVALITNSELMSEEAQNSILKLLEEPPKDTIIILLTKSIRDLKPTIISRSAIIKLVKPTYEEFAKYFTNDNLGQDSKNKYDLTDGNSDYFNKYLEKAVDLSSAEDIVLIKKFLASSRSDRLLMINDFCSNNIIFENLIFTLRNIIKIGLNNSIQKNNNQTKMWISYLKAIEMTENGFAILVNRKLLFTNLCLNM
jgi:hypothetical protein